MVTVSVTVYYISDIQVTMLGIFNHVESMKIYFTLLVFDLGIKEVSCLLIAVKKNTKSILPVEFFTNDTRFVKDFSVLLNRTTARDW